MQFIIIATVLTVVVLALVLYPVFRRQLPVALALLVISALTTGALYSQLGTPQALDARLVKQPTSMKDAIFQLEYALQREPARVEGWALLAQTYRQDGQLVKSRDAWARALALSPQDAALMTNAAEARAMADPQHRFDAQAVDLLENAVKLEPDHERARWFLGVAMRQQGRDQAAVDAWSPLLTRVAPEAAEALLPQLNAARAAAGLPAVALPAKPAAASGLAVELSIDPALRRDPRWTAASRIFVIARVPNGPPMPIAARKLSLDELPAKFVLSDADSPMPTAKLSAVKTVEVFARLSASGEANRGEGDLETAPQRVSLPAAAPVKLELRAP